MKRFLKAALLTTGLLSLTNWGALAQGVEYRTPSKEVTDMILAKPLPELTFNGPMTYAAAAQAEVKYRPVSYIASINEFKLAGLRLDGSNFSQTRQQLYDGVSIICVSDGSSKPVSGLPEGALLHSFKWSPNGRYLCFLNNAEKEVELYRVDAFALNPKAEKINTRPVNSIFGNAFCFISESTVLYKSVPEDIGAFPKRELPKGPIVQESDGKKHNYRTYQDLLKSPYDEAVFEYLCTAELSLFDGTNTTTVGGKGIISSFKASPDGRYVLVKTIRRPFSYSEKYDEFPSADEIIDMSGSTVKVLDAEKDGVRRSAWDWRADRAATLCWFEKRNGVDKDNASRTSLCQCDAPFDGREVILNPAYDINSVIWGTETIAFCTDRSDIEKVRRTYSFNPSDPKAKRVILRSESTYNLQPAVSSFVGNFVLDNGKGTMKMDPKHTYVLMTGDNRFDGTGGKYWFIDRISLKDGSATNVWNSKAPYKTTVLGVPSITDKGITVIAKKESATEVPNYVSISIDKKGAVKERAFTSYVSTLPHLEKIRKEYITYKRADGIECAARVFVPADWDKERDGALPVFMWTYPREHYTKESAEYSYRADKYGYTMPDQWNQIFWCLKGYAVVLEWTMAIVAEDKDGDYNKNFVKELTMSAEGIIDALVEQGYGDRDRMAVGGLSYGSFMTANLLAHTTLYKVGFANSGAFNRSLTPFGFQYYGKTFWESMDIYNQMSPYNYADKIKTPILITHGMMDENTGTHPIQSERLYYAVAGHNGKARYLQIPYEGHRMAWEENVLLYFSIVEEMLDKYVKDAKPEEKK